MTFPNHHPVLISNDLLLKEVTEKDFPELAEIVAMRPKKDLNAKELLDRIRVQWEEQSGINWGMYINGELAGTIGFYRGFENDRGEIGYVMREKFRRQGITSKAIKTVIDYGRSIMQLKEIVAYTSETNEASRGLLDKLNFIQVSTTDPEYIKYQLQD